MKLGRSRSTPAQARAPLRLLWAWLSIVVLIAGVLAWEQAWHHALIPRVPRALQRLAARIPARDLPALVVDVDFVAYDRILQQRERALHDGVYLPAEDDHVPATVRLDGTATPVGMRVMPGPARYDTAPDGWNLEIHTRGEARILGLRRFFLQEPAAVNWLDGWAYARALQREGVLCAQIEFVQLVLNGDDWGVFALQETLSGELLAAQGRARGPIVGFDRSVPWASIAHHRGDLEAALADPIANLAAENPRALDIDPYRDADVAQDPAIEAQRDSAVALLRALQTGARAPSEVLDVEQYGAYLALNDLWGASGPASFVDRGYYYDAASQRLAPIAFNARPLASTARISLHDAYGDPSLQLAYLRHAARLAQPSYVDQLEAALEGEWQSLAYELGSVNRDLVPPWETLRRRQVAMRRSLDPVHPVVAYLDADHLASQSLSDDAALHVYVGNALSIPVEILGFDVNGVTFLPVDPAWLQAEATDLLVGGITGVVLAAPAPARHPRVHYAGFDIPLAVIQAQDREIDFDHTLDIHVSTQVVSGAGARLTPVRLGAPVGGVQ